MYEYQAKIVRVVDGDSVWMEVDVGFRMSYKYNFRLAGINTPELNSSDENQRVEARAAKSRLEELLPQGAPVRIVTTKPGKYGRWLTHIWTEGSEKSVNEILLEEGYAVAYMA